MSITLELNALLEAGLEAGIDWREVIAREESKKRDALNPIPRALWFASLSQWKTYWQSELPKRALELLEPALNDEPEAGLSLSVTAHDYQRGRLAVFFWLHARNTTAFREILSDAWEMNHRFVIAALQNRADLERLFLDARFEIPNDWPDRVVLYRGTSKLPLAMAKRGYSWTTDKRVAAFFAMRFASFNGNPLVLRATVPKRSILYYSNERSEAEAICFHVRGAKQDGSPEEWEELEIEYTGEAKKEREKRLLEYSSKEQTK